MSKIFYMVVVLALVAMPAVRSFGSTVSVPRPVQTPVSGFDAARGR